MCVMWYTQRFYIDVDHIFIRILDTVKEIDMNQKSTHIVCVCEYVRAIAHETQSEYECNMEKRVALCIDNNISYDKDE